jgi:hypothetical protein
MISAGLLSFVLFPLEYALKAAVVFVAGFILLGVIFVLAIWPAVVVSFYFLFPTPLVVFGVVKLMHLISFLLFLVLLLSARSFVASEFNLIKKVGPKHALWVDNSSRLHSLFGAPYRYVVVSFDVEDDRLLGQFQSSWLKQFVSDGSFSTYYELTSIVWSRFIVWLHTELMPGPRVSWLVSLWCLNCLLFLWLKPLKRTFTFIRYYVVLCFVVFTLQPGAIIFGIGVSFRLLKFVLSLISTDFYQWCVWTATALAVDVTNYAIEYNFVSRKWFSRSGFLPSSKSSKLIPVFTESIAKLAVVISDLGLPHYIMGGKGTYDAEHIQETLDLMADAGWPINVNLTQPSRFGSSQAYADWLVSGTDWQQGIHNRKVYVDTALDPLRVKAVEWRRTEEYRTTDNELKSISRYFQSPRYDYPDLDINDVWYLVGDIFRYSRITPMNYIIKMWEKKYALGSFMVDPNNPRKKYSRWKFISTIGYANFKKLWRSTFEFAPMLAPVAHVSVKDEALPPRKYLADKLRTVVGSPLGQYIMSTVWNYSPNHNFQWRTTPIKVGMPLNGYWMDFVYTNHARCQIHYAGDMSEFDSTLSGNVLKLISSIRKKGFENHKDHDRIARLIDINYRQVEHQLLNTTSTGDIYAKGSGLTTGHSSTSMDNSVGLVVLYLLAWKQITGLSAKEFKYYNELSCFGDDHLLSVAGNKPAAWNFRSIQSAMSKWGVTNNLEATGPLENIAFLSKRVRSPTAADLEDFRRAGVKTPRYAVYHERDRLIGKMVSKIKTMAPQYRLKRLVSYLSLTAHHPDVYSSVVGVIKRTRTFSKYVKGPQNPSGIHVPSYEKIVHDWYKPDANFPENMIDEVQENYASDKTILTYGALSPLDSLLGALAIVPDFVNPAIFNMGYMTTLQSKLFKTVSWPVQLIALSNGAAGPAELSYMLRKTVYEFLDPSILVHVDSDTNYTSLLIRHWAFLWFKSLPTKLPELFPIAGFARKVAQVQFVMNAKLQVESRRWSFQVHDLLVISALSFVHVPDILQWAQKVSLPDVNLLSEQVMFFVQNFFWSSLPPNYNDVTGHLRKLDGSKTLVVSAPTGSGKSTAFVRHTMISVGHKYNKIIVVEPRSTIVKTIVPFVNNSLSMAASGATSGMTLDQEAKVWYVTAQELLLHPSWYSGESSQNLILLDECHVTEPAYDLVKDILVSQQVHRVFISATPDFSQLDPSSVIDIPLVSARLYNVHISNVSSDDVVTLSDFNRHYISDVMSMIHSRPVNSVVLVFCTTLGMCNQMSELCPRKSFVLSSGTNVVPAASGGYVIFSTSVADVGITLPDVDLVISSDVGFTVLNTMEKSIPAYYRLTDSDLKQRAGRTGRTNNGSAVMFKCPKARFVSDVSELKAKTSAFDLLASGMPLDSIIQLRGDELKELLGLTDIPKERADATLNTSLYQLNLYRSNLEPLLNERAKMLEIGTNDGSVSHPIDSARMGILLETTKIPTTELIQAVLNVVKHLGLRSTANAEQSEMHAEEIRRSSAILLGNIKSKLPFPDPDLGEWGMAPDDVDDFYRFVGRAT